MLTVLYFIKLLNEISKLSHAKFPATAGVTTLNVIFFSVLQMLNSCISAKFCPTLQNKPSMESLFMYKTQWLK